MQSINQTLAERNTEIVVVSADSVDDNRRLAKKKRFNFHLLADPELTVIDLFGFRHQGAGITGNDIARPAVLIANKTGQITWIAATSNWRVRVRPETILKQTEGFN